MAFSRQRQTETHFLKRQSRKDETKTLQQIQRSSAILTWTAGRGLGYSAIAEAATSQQHEYNGTIHPFVSQDRRRPMNDQIGTQKHARKEPRIRLPNSAPLLHIISAPSPGSLGIFHLLSLPPKIPGYTLGKGRHASCHHSVSTPRGGGLEASRLLVD